ncbi:unnamed protein product [Echinostoma caproni]|uniref:40S ribosomal protein S15 n=1 Tax=Echinostoma caproni TaxID=27848 RepID=A0A183BBP6_9TREM|nr:unnamed protein product [Echinostoma caproni]
MEPSTEPCGTSIETGENEETAMPIQTAKERFDRTLVRNVWHPVKGFAKIYKDRVRNMTFVKYYPLR